MFRDWTIQTGDGQGYYETDKRELYYTAVDFPKVYEYATFMQPRGVLVTKRDLSPKGKPWFGSPAWLQEKNAFPGGRPHPWTGNPLYWFQRSLPRFQSTTFGFNFNPLWLPPAPELPGIIQAGGQDPREWAATASDKVETWYTNRVYDLVGVPIDLNLARNPTAAPGPAGVASSGGVATSARVADIISKLQNAIQNGTKTEVKEILSKYVKKELSRREMTAISREIDDLIVLAELNDDNSIKRALGALKKVVSKQETIAKEKAIQKKRERKQRRLEDWRRPQRRTQRRRKRLLIGKMQGSHIYCRL